MRRTRRGGGKHRRFPTSSDEPQRTLDHDSISAPSTSSQSQSQQNPGPAGKSISDSSPVTPSQRRNLKPDFSLRTDEGVAGPSESSERVLEESEAETNKGLDSNEFDAMDRLEELGFGVEEPELSEEQMRTNSQAQEDELLVIESIYGNSVLKLDRQMGLQSFQVHINIEATNGITVTTKLNSSSDDKPTGSQSLEDFSYSFEVQYLPPIVLTCLLPKSYPSHHPPHFTLSVQWLDSTKASGLCSMLDSIWKEQPGQEIVYQWVEWLTSSSLSYLGFEKEIILGSYGTRYIEDRRVISGSVSPDVDIPLIRRYNDERLHENFLLNSHECCICFSEYAGSEFVRLPCHHFFCWKCMKTYSDMHVHEGTVIQLQCPESKCGGEIPPSLLKRLLNQEEYERWESLTLQKTLESMSDVAYCPRCETPCIVDGDQHAQCSVCFFSFCTLCRERRHVGVECMTPELKLAILQERQDSIQLKEAQRKKELEMINELLSIRAILRDAKQCPSCSMAISKIAGCNRMVCKNCGKYFCYQCNEAIDGYDHFSAGKCGLLTQEPQIKWDERKNDRHLLAQACAELFVEEGPGQFCPSCGMFNLKLGNKNHLVCIVCQAHYCYLCRLMVRRGTHHYGPQGCKPHSDD